MCGKNRIPLALAVLLIPFCFSLTVNPLEYRIQETEPGKEYQLVLTVINQEATDYEINADVDRMSMYLAEATKIEPSSFLIGANSKENVKLSIDIPESLSPETHNLKIAFTSNGLRLGEFNLYIEVPGEQIVGADLAEFDFNNITSAEPLYFYFQVENTGNTIVRGKPIVQIFQVNSELDSIYPESDMIIMPGGHSNFSIMYDPSALNPGEYTVKGSFSYNGKTTQAIEKGLLIETKEAHADLKTIEPGSKLYHSFEIVNPTGSLSFYRVRYKVRNTDIEGEVDGELKETHNLVEIVVPTEELNEGNYGLELEISSGRTLEHTEKQEVGFVIQKKKGDLLNYVFSIGVMTIGGLTLAFIAYVIFFVISKRSHLKKAPVSRMELIAKEISTISRKYDSLEHNLRGLSKEINIFSNETREFLSRREQHG